MERKRRLCDRAEEKESLLENKFSSSTGITIKMKGKGAQNTPHSIGATLKVIFDPLGILWIGWKMKHSKPSLG